MKRFLLFSGNYYYPLGGWNDFDASFDSIDEATAAVTETAEWAHVIDSQTGEKLWEKEDDEEEESE
jgi:hypothetical protein